MISDRELAARVAGTDDQAAFQALVERHQAGIRRFLRRLLAGDHATADDLAQETFLQAYRKLAGWRGQGRFDSWLHTIAYRQFLQFRRKHARQTVMAEPPEASEDTREAIEAEILVPRLLERVSEYERVCLTLAYSAGMSHPEISDVTGMALGTVKSHIQRGKQKLQNWLSKHDHSFSEANQAAGANPARGANRA